MSPVKIPKGTSPNEEPAHLTPFPSPNSDHSSSTALYRWSQFPHHLLFSVGVYIPRDKGDFYYAGGFFGWSVPEVYRLTTACHQAMTADQAQGIEAVWHDESHLNRYLLSHKPSKVLSPDYLWDERMLQRPPLLRKLRYVAVPKNHAEIRNR